MVAKRLKKIPVVERDIEGNDGTVASGLREWSARTGPVMYNAWQSAYFQLKRPPFSLLEPEAVEGEMTTQAGRKAVQARCAALYHSIQRELHGGSWLVTAMRRGITIPPEADEMSIPDDEHEESVTTLAVREPEGDGSQGRQEAGRSAAGLPHAQTEHHQLFTPPRSEATTESPDRILEEPGIEEVWHDHEATHTELSEEMEERLGR